MRRFLPSPPPRQEIADLETGTPADLRVHGGARTDVEARGEGARARVRRRLPWAQLLRRLLHVDALSCPQCSTRARSVPMVVLAFLTDPDVVGRILRHLGLPACAPALAPARVASWEQPSGHLPPPVPCADVGVGRVEEGAGADSSCGGESGSADLSTSPPLIRPPP